MSTRSDETLSYHEEIAKFTKDWDLRKRSLTGKNPVSNVGSTALKRNAKAIVCANLLMP